MFQPLTSTNNPLNMIYRRLLTGAGCFDCVD